MTLRLVARSFLNDVERIAAREYEPSDSDIVRARLRTMGVQEYGIKFEIGESSFPSLGEEEFDYRFPQGLLQGLSGLCTTSAGHEHR